MASLHLMAKLAMAIKPEASIILLGEPRYLIYTEITRA